MTPEQRLQEAGLTLPPAPPRGGVYKPVVRVGNVAYVSGHGPFRENETYVTGRVGDELSLEEGRAAARQTGLAILATLKAEFGELSKVKRVVKLLGMVNCPPTFGEHPKVINGCSELFGLVWGEDAGIGARSAVGMGSLPGNIAVEIEGIFEIE
ncbi:MAG: RidA family protein [Verrucomicrobiaceae bacterium]|nr:RidA family protein [Verrucomicrobiaceae bacterium]